jgi:hypothetical protein
MGGEGSPQNLNRFSQVPISRSTACGLNKGREKEKNMNKNPMNKGVLTENASGIGTVTPEMVEARARELAAIAGRVPPQPSEVDYEQAKRELTGGPDSDILDQVLESIPESERWDPVRGSIGHHTPESFGEDEDSEGRSESAQLVEEGIKEAEHDQMLQAARAAQKEDQREP